MTKISKSKLSQLYSSDEIAEIWNANQHLAVIEHPQKGLISPNQYRTMAKEKPCPFCGKKMKHGERHPIWKKTQIRYVPVHQG